MFISTVMRVYEDNLEEVLEQLKRKRFGKTKFVFYDEEIYIDIIQLPMVKRAWMNNLIINNLIYNFEDISSLSFSYEVISIKNKKCKIILYCINSKKNILYESLNTKHKVVGVYLIQHCYHYFVRKILKVKDFILVFDSKKRTYLNYSCQGVLKKSFIYNRNDEETVDIIDTINKIFLDDYLNKDIQTPPILIINYEKIDLLMKALGDSNIRNMGRIDENTIIKKYVGVF